MIKIGVIGYGYSARTFHLPLIESSDQFEFTAISTSRPDEVRLKYPSVSIYKTPHDLITASEVELVIITAPNDVHFHLAKLCLENDKHVVLEKPMVTKSSEAKQLVELAGNRCLALSVFHNRRWDGDFLTAKKIIEEKLVGDIRYFESHFDRFRPDVRKRWREMPGLGNGIWFDLGSHMVDQAVCLFGLPESLTARCLSIRKNSEVTDYFHVLLHYRELEAVLHASSLSAAPNKRFHIEGTRGSYIKYGFDPQEAQLKNGMSPLETGFGIEEREEFGTLYNGTDAVKVNTEAGCYQEYYSGIAKAINNKGVCPVKCGDALNIIKIIELAEFSSRTGKTVALE
jgi:scyllo-inositol 2-dehydrogenase (NADP+)